MPRKVVTVLPWQDMMNLDSIVCKIDANSNKLSVLLEPHIFIMLVFYRILWLI